MKRKENEVKEDDDDEKSVEYKKAHQPTTWNTVLQMLWQMCDNVRVLVLAIHSATV